MILAVDIGNSNIVFGCIDEQKIYFVARMATDRSRMADQYAVEIKNIIGLYGSDYLDKIDGAIISSVVPPLSLTFREAIVKVTGKAPLLVGPGIKTGLNILMDDPAKLGGDLVVDAVAAIAEYKHSIAVIDMGTATTISVIDKNACYIGGVIIPGVRMSVDALSARAAQLPAISLETPPKRVIGKNTIDCMTSGVIMANASMIDGMLDRIEDELGYPVTAVATGGIAPFIVSYCRRKVICDDNLLLKGLYLVYKKNS